MHTTVDAWADIVTKQWRGAINKLNIHSTGALFESIAYDVIGGDKPDKVRFTFKDYGVYVNFGVGKETRIGNKGVNTSRRAKKWYTPVIFREIDALSRILADKYGEKAAGVIVSAIQSDVQTR